MSSIKLKVKNKAQFDSRLDKQGKNVRKNMERVVNSITNEVRNIAVRSILQNSRGGGISKRYNPKRTVNVSKAGNPPASDTGFLASNISSKIDADKLGAEVISNADYSEALEFGTINMSARPFMQPAAEEARKKYKLDSIGAIKKGLK
jgi:HK97 gp10 family phage protein